MGMQAQICHFAESATTNINAPRQPRGVLRTHTYHGLRDQLLRRDSADHERRAHTH